MKRVNVETKKPRRLKKELSSVKEVDKPVPFKLEKGVIFQAYLDNYIVVQCGCDEVVAVNLVGFGWWDDPFEEGIMSTDYFDKSLKIKYIGKARKAITVEL